MLKPRKYRSLQGPVYCVPNGMMCKWIPIHERNRCLTLVVAGKFDEPKSCNIVVLDFENALKILILSLLHMHNRFGFFVCLQAATLALFVPTCCVLSWFNMLIGGTFSTPQELQI